MIKAILIDPFAKSFSEGEIENDCFDTAYRLMDCDLVTILNVGDNDLFVDEEGLYKRVQAYFRIGNTPRILCGKALLVGPRDDHDNSTDVVGTIEDARELITFVPTTRRETDV